jgi:hypothetical protein
MPMPNAFVATTTSSSREANALDTRVRASASMPAW